MHAEISERDVNLRFIGILCLSVCIIIVQMAPNIQCFWQRVYSHNIIHTCTYIIIFPIIYHQYLPQVLLISVCQARVG
jgi:hypothetical protein